MSRKVQLFLNLATQVADRHKTLLSLGAIASRLNFITSRAIVTPAAVEEYNNVTSTAIITVPRGCCFSIGVRAVSGLVDDAAGTPAPSINVTNSNLVITRIA